MAGKKSKNIVVWVQSIYNLLEHCTEGKIVPSTCKTARIIKEESEAFTQSHSDKFSDAESQLLNELQNYLFYFDGDMSEPKTKMRAKEALYKLHPLVKWLEKHGALKVDYKSSNEENWFLIQSMKWMEDLLNALKEVINSDDWDRWTKRISQRKKDANRNRIPINKKVKEYLEDRQAFFNEPSFQAFTDKLGEEYDIRSTTYLQRLELRIEKLEKRVVENEKILVALQDSGILNDTLKALIEHDVKIKANQRYRVGKMEPVQDGLDRVVRKLKPVEDGADFLMVNLDKKKKK